MPTQQPDQKQPYQPSFAEVPVHNHRQLGKEFESDCISTHSEYLVRSIAMIDRNPDHWKYISKKEYESSLRNPSTKSLVAVTGDGYYMRRHAANVDFSGVAKIPLLQYGCAVKFDAKMTAGDRIPLGNFEKHQVENLCLSARCGALAGFMINFYVHQRVFFCPALFVQKKMDRNFGKLRAAPGDGSISIAELETHGTEIPYGRRFIDWHKVLIHKGR